jgi:hypothetical protein
MSQVPFDRSSTHGLEINEARIALFTKNVEPVRRTMQHIANAPARSQDFERTQESLSVGITQRRGEKWVMKPSLDEVKLVGKRREFICPLDSGQCGVELAKGRGNGSGWKLGAGSAHVSPEGDVVPLALMNGSREEARRTDHGRRCFVERHCGAQFPLQPIWLTRVDLRNNRAGCQPEDNVVRVLEKDRHLDL